MPEIEMVTDKDLKEMIYKVWCKNPTSNNNPKFIAKVPYSVIDSLEGIATRYTMIMDNSTSKDNINMYAPHTYIGLDGMIVQMLPEKERKEIELYIKVND